MILIRFTNKHTLYQIEKKIPKYIYKKTHQNAKLNTVLNSIDSCKFKFWAPLLLTDSPFHKPTQREITSLTCPNFWLTFLSLISHLHNLYLKKQSSSWPKIVPTSNWLSPSNHTFKVTIKLLDVRTINSEMQEYL